MFSLVSARYEQAENGLLEVTIIEARIRLAASGSTGM
jgi:hypothetical protein